MVGTLEGNVSLRAGERYMQTGRGKINPALPRGHRIIPKGPLKEFQNRIQ